MAKAGPIPQRTIDVVRFYMKQLSGRWFNDRVIIYERLNMRIEKVTHFSSPCDALRQYRMLHDTMVVARDKLRQNSFDLFFVAGFIGRTLHFGLVQNSKLEGWAGSKIVLVPNLLTGAWGRKHWQRVLASSVVSPQNFVFPIIFVMNKEWDMQSKTCEVCKEACHKYKCPSCSTK